MTEPKLLAEWFWIDRWVGSTAFLLPIDARGLYREMLTQAWRREARLLNHPETIRRAVGVTVKEWNRCWPLVERFWRVEGGYLVNDTQREVYADAKARQDVATTRAKTGAEARWGPLRDKRSRRDKIATARAKGQHTIEQWQALLRFTNSTCLSCHVAGYVEKDHVIPIAFGGDDSIENLQPLCALCNIKKGNKPTDYRAAVPGFSEWLRQCTGNAQAMPSSEAMPEPSPLSLSPSLSPKIPPKKFITALPDEQWERFKATYPGKGREQGYLAQQAFLAGVAAVGFAVLLAGVERYAKSKAVKDGYVMGMGKWLEKGLWIQEPDSVAPAPRVGQRVTVPSDEPL